MQSGKKGSLNNSVFFSFFKSTSLSLVHVSCVFGTLNVKAMVSLLTDIGSYSFLKQKCFCSAL